MADQAWVTLATNDSYSLGAMVLASSLRRVNTTRQLAVMVTSGVSPPMRAVLESLFNLVVEVNVLDSQDAANLALLTRPELGITFTKLHCWRLVQYSKCVFLDADTLVLQNCDDLFDREEFSAAPDAGWPDCFNSGVFVFKPCLDTYSSLLAFAIETGSFDGGDQGLLNSYFNDWSTSDITRHLPFIYNMVASAVYSYLPAYRIFGQNVRIAHFIGPEKPWLQHFDTETGQVRPPGGQEHLAALLQSWWDIFRGEIHLRLSPEMSNESATFMEQVQSTFTTHISPTEQQHQEYLPNPSSNTSSYFIYQSHFQPPMEQSQSPQSHFQPPKEQSQSPQSYFQPPMEQSQSPQSPAATVYNFNQSHSHAPNSSPVPDPAHIAPSNPPKAPENILLVAIQRFPPENVYRPMPIEVAVPRLQTRPTSPQSKSRSQSQPNLDRNNSNFYHSHSESSPSNSSHTPISIPQELETEILTAQDDKGLAGAYAKMSLEGTKTTEQIEYVNEMRKQDWEAGRIDYLGQDSFDNILKKIQASVAQGAAARAKSPSPPKSKAPKPAPALAPETAASPSGVQASDEKVVSAADSPPIESVPATVESASDPGESKAVSVPDIVDSVPSAVESAPVSVDSTPATIELATLPVEVALEPVGPEAPAPLGPEAPAPLEPAAPAPLEPAAPAAVPVEPAAAPVEPTAAPVEPAQAPAEPAAAPVELAQAPAEPAAAPLEVAATPVELTSAPVELTSASVEPALAPVEPAAVPVEPAAPLVEPAPSPLVEQAPATPVEPASASVEPTSAPVEPASAPVEPASAPVEPASAPVEPASAPVEPAPVESVLATVESAPVLVESAPVPDSLIATAPIPIPDSTGSIPAPASEPPAQAPIPEVVAAVQTPEPESTPAATVKPAPELTSEQVPVPEPAATQASLALDLDSTKPKEPEPAAKTAEELEDARLAQERQAVEKKLSEQKKIAEQKLQEEKAAAVAAAAASAPVPAEAPPVDAPAPGVGATGAAAGPKPPGTASGIPQPKAPPRAKQPSKARTFSQKLGYGIGIGIVAAAIGIGTYYGGGIDTTKLFR